MRPKQADWAWIPWFILGVALLVTIAGTLYVRQMNQRMEQARFRAAVLDAEKGITARIDTYVNVLRATGGLFAGSQSVAPEEFHAYVERLELPTRYPGIQGVGFTQQVPAAQKDAFLADMRRQGLTRDDAGRPEPFAIWPDSPREDYHAIIYLEPLDRRNHAAIGYDMFTEPTRARAMAMARDTGSAVASAKVRLVQEIDDDVQAGFLIYVPVYRGGTIPPTVEERREKLLGFVYAPFRAGDLLKGILADEDHPDLEFAVYDGTEIAAEHLLYHSNSQIESHEAAGLRTTTRVMQSSDQTWKDRPWTVVFTATPQFESASGSTLERTVPLAGLLISGVLFFLTRTQARALAERRRSAEERLELLSREQAARQEAERANRLKDEFLATVSHDLRTPLSAILGWAQLLRSDKVDPVLIRQGLEAIERNSRIQSQLIEDLLDVSRIITGRLKLSIEPIHLAQVIDSAIDTVRHAADAKGIELVTSLDPLASPIMGDSARLQQVAWNLLSNAIKFTPDGGRVKVRLKQVGESHVELIVRDNGQGITPEFLPYVFDRFSQADTSSTRRHGGLGLGLAITRHLVESHGGTIHAYSEGAGKGTTFTVRLPVHQSAANPLTGEHTQAVVQTGPESATRLAMLEGIRVLVVDDQQDARELMRTILTQAHAQVTAVGSVREALAIIGSTKPHVLISDISMPEEDGYALIRQIRALPREQGGQIPAIALTAYAKTEDHRRAMEAGFQVHLAKPVEAAYITKLVTQLGGQANQMPPSAPIPGHPFPQTPPDVDAAENAHWIVDTEEASGPARSR